MASSSGLDGAASLDRTCSSMSGSSFLTIAVVFLRRHRKYCVGSASFRQISRLGGGLISSSLWAFVGEKVCRMAPAGSLQPPVPLMV